MKKVEAVIKPFKLDAIKEALAKDGLQGMRISEVRDLSRQKGRVALYRGAEYVVDTTKVRIEVIVEDDEAKAVVDTIIAVLRTGHLCDSEIAILPVEAVIRIRIGEG